MFSNDYVSYQVEVAFSKKVEEGGFQSLLSDHVGEVVVVG